jgi:hypothetical protein
MCRENLGDKGSFWLYGTLGLGPRWLSEKQQFALRIEIATSLFFPASDRSDGKRLKGRCAHWEDIFKGREEFEF